MTELNVQKELAVSDTDITSISVERDRTNGVRVGIIITNTSPGTQVIYLAIDGDAVTGAGIVLYPGGSWADSMDGGYFPTQKRITAISDAANGVVAIQERIGGA